MLTLLLIGMLSLTFNIQHVKSDWTWTETIYIRADGSVDPDTAPISSVDNITYTFTDNIVGDVPELLNAIVVERDDVVVDGAGYTLQGTGSGAGIALSGRSNVTIKNMEIKAFNEYGLLLSSSSNNIMLGNNITDNGEGISLSNSSNNRISENNISDNWNGVSLGSSSNNTICGNSIEDSDYSGVFVSGSLNTDICENNLVNNMLGIYLSHYSSNNVISRNNVTNTNTGVAIAGQWRGWGVQLTTISPEIIWQTALVVSVLWG